QIYSIPGTTTGRMPKYGLPTGYRNLMDKSLSNLARKGEPMPQLHTAALTIKNDVYDIIGDWGIAAILEVLEFRVQSEIDGGEYNEDQIGKANATLLVRLLNQAQKLTD